jgi:hypothetical protein
LSTKSKLVEPLKEWDIQAEPEPYEESYLPEDESQTTTGGDGTMIEGDDADAKDTVSGVDKEFLIFQERLVPSLALYSNEGRTD